jgi:hypothetical protein
MLEYLLERRVLAGSVDKVRLTDQGRRFFTQSGIDVAALEQGRRPLCRSCLDWSERRYHLGGAVGAAVFQHIQARGWAVREARTRIVRFSPSGERNAKAWYSRKSA